MLSARPLGGLSAVEFLGASGSLRDVAGPPWSTDGVTQADPLLKPNCLTDTFDNLSLTPIRGIIAYVILALKCFTLQNDDVLLSICRS
jgi:hypothetical protein